MTLELEKLTGTVEEMAQGAYRQRQANDAILEALEQKLRAHATAWDKMEATLDKALRVLDPKWYRSARPLDDVEPLDATIDPPQPPPQATVIATDGSQILPNRHGAYLYSLINVGVIAYFHGHGRAPLQETRPELDYPDANEDEDAETFVDKAAIVNLRRDRAEIETLADTAWAHRDGAKPLLAVLDQRLLYWPATGDAEGKQVLDAWQAAMTKARDSGGLLAGYIDRPAKRSVLTLLDTLDILEPDFDAGELEARNARPGLNDTHLFRRLLRPGQRSKVFVDVSQHNTDFADRDPLNEVCFFYLNPGRVGSQIARIDIPLSVAQDPDAVDAVHALLYDQCRILGDYPYVLTRADELAVVTFEDRESLEVIIANAMEKYGLAGAVTAKQSTKDVARAGRTRHAV